MSTRNSTTGLPAATICPVCRAINVGRCAGTCRGIAPSTPVDINSIVLTVRIAGRTVRL